jgi:phosphoglycerate kinase
MPATVRYRKRTLRHLAPEGKRVLMRVDFNVPVKSGEVTDDTRIVGALPSIRYLLQKRARLVLMSHLGRPKGKPQAEFSLKPVANRLTRLLRQPVECAPDCVGPETSRLAASLADAQVLLLENLRFHAEEEANDSAFARSLAELGDMYVNDAFGTAHRAHASTEGVTHHLHPAVAGFLMEKELEYLGRALDRPDRPFVAVIGGAKISGKIDVLTSMLERVDRLLVGGAMMFTFFRAMGVATGRSLVEDDRVDMARAVIDGAKRRGVDLLLPVDCVVSTATDGSAPSSVVASDAIGASYIGVDIGPATVERFDQALHDARSVVWNGPMGIFEVEAFAEGTRSVARSIASAGTRGAMTIVGGGDSVAAVQQLGLADAFSHLSTGGGASLEFLEGKILPGVAALDDAENG